MKRREMGQSTNDPGHHSELQDPAQGPEGPSGETSGSIQRP